MTKGVGYVWWPSLLGEVYFNDLTSRDFIISLQCFTKTVSKRSMESGMWYWRSFSVRHMCSSYMEGLKNGGGGLGFEKWDFVVVRRYRISIVNHWRHLKSLWYSQVCSLILGQDTDIYHGDFTNVRAYSYHGCNIDSTYLEKSLFSVVCVTIFGWALLSH